MAATLVAAIVATADASAQSADAAAGADIYAKKCERCHTVNAGGAQQDGPNLHGIFGRKAATTPGWTFSPALQASNIVWTPETLDGYIAKPKEFVPEGTMNFPGLKKPEERAAVIQYMQQATK